MPTSSEAEPAGPIEPAAHRMRLALLLAIAFVAGAGVALQSRINGQLGAQLGDGFFAAAISFGSGFVILAIGALFWRPGRRGIGQVVTALRTRRIPWWYVMGGAGGAFFVLTQSLVVGLVGVALFTVGVVAGQTLSSLLIDRMGIGSIAANPVTLPRLIGALVAVLAVVLAASPELRGDLPFWVLLGPFIAGLGIGGQQAVNGQIRTVAGSAFTATFGNFLVGAFALLVVAVIHTAIVGWPAHVPAAPWLYLGGPVGIAFIAAQTIIVRTTGVLLMGLALLSGQLVTAVAFDLAAPPQSHGIAPLTVVGAGLTLVGVVIAAIPTRAARRQGSSGTNPSDSEFMQ